MSQAIEHAIAKQLESVDQQSRHTRWTTYGLIGGNVLFGALLSGSIAANIILATKPPPEPTVFMMDELGTLRMASRVTNVDLSEKQAYIRSVLRQYIIHREGYDRSFVWQDYGYVQLHSGHAVFKTYSMRFKKDDPNNIYKRLGGDRLQVDSENIQISEISSNLHHLEYSVRRYESGGGEPISTRYYSAYVQWGFNSDEMSLTDRDRNPFGFQVTEWRRDLVTKKESS